MVFVRLALFPGATAEQYAALATTAGSVAPAHRLFFAAGPVEDGWQVVQAWRSRADLDDFNRRVLFPAYAELGGSPFPTAPVVTDFEAADAVGEAM